MRVQRDQRERERSPRAPAMPDADVADLAEKALIKVLEKWSPPFPASHINDQMKLIDDSYKGVKSSAFPRFADLLAYIEKERDFLETKKDNNNLQVRAGRGTRRRAGARSRALAPACAR